MRVFCLMQEKKTTLSKLEHLQDSIKDLNKVAARAGANTASAREIRGLENRLDKALVKCNEAMSIRRTYEQVWTAFCPPHIKT